MKGKRKGEGRKKNQRRECLNLDSGLLLLLLLLMIVKEIF